MEIWRTAFPGDLFCRGRCKHKEQPVLAFRSSSYVGYSAGNRAVYQKALPVLSNMADNPAISSLQLLTIVYYNNCYFVATTRLCMSRAVTRKPLWVGGGGGA